MKIVIRPAKISDALGIATVHVKTWKNAYKDQIPDSYLNSLSIDEKTKSWENQLRNPYKGSHAFVAEVDELVVGWCTGGISRDEDSFKETGELYGIYILPDYIGKGLGTKLMDKLLATLKDEKYTKATLWVLETNEKTRKWYESKGWKVEGTSKVDKRDGFDLHEIRYVIDLRSISI